MNGLIEEFARETVPPTVRDATLPSIVVTGMASRNARDKAVTSARFLVTAISRPFILFSKSRTRGLCVTLG